MAAQIKQLLLPNDLEDVEKMSGLPASDRDALLGVSRWLHEFIACPHAQLGRAGTVCPFIPGSLERRVLWFAPEHIADLDTAGVVDLMKGYQRFFLEMAPADMDDAVYKTIIVTFPDCPPERAGTLFADVLGELGDAAYREDGILFGPFYEGNPGTAIYNAGFRPFQSPTPFLFVRHTVLSDWKFFVDDDALIERWARRFEPAGAVALAQELRQQPWRKRAEWALTRGRAAIARRCLAEYASSYDRGKSGESEHAAQGGEDNNARALARVRHSPAARINPTARRGAIARIAGVSDRLGDLDVVAGVLGVVGGGRARVVASIARTVVLLICAGAFGSAGVSLLACAPSVGPRGAQ